MKPTAVLSSSHTASSTVMPSTVKPTKRRSLALIPALFTTGPFGSSSPKNVSSGPPSLNPIAHWDQKADMMVASSSSVPQKAAPSTENAPPAPESKSPLRPRSKSRTILRFLGSKIRPSTVKPSITSPTVTSPPANKTKFAVRAPTPANTFATKENREAALRERGLLPPLKPNKDLSRQELEHDQRLPIVTPVEVSATTAPNEAGIESITVANLIKKEWEAKNHSGEDEQQQERLKSFRFGAISSQVKESQMLDVASEAPDAERTSVVKTDQARNPHSPPVDGCHQVVPQAVDVGKGTREKDQMVSPSLDSRQGPLPPSSTNAERRALGRLDLMERDTLLGQLSPASIPLPASPTHTSTPASPRSTHSESGDRDLKPLPPRPISPQTPTPVLSLSPAVQEMPVLDRDAVDPRKHRRSDSFPLPLSVSESLTSLAAPSLDTSSHSTTLSTMATSESSPRIKATTLTGARNIPMIVESPIEECPALMEEPIPISGVEGPIEELQENMYVHQEKLGSETEPIPPQPNSRRKKRPAIFRSGRATDSTGQLTKRLTVSASLNNMRRSVANTLSRTKSTVNIGGSKRFDPTQLPPSPTYPMMASNGRRTSESSAADTARPPRQAVAPILYSQGTILQETNAIEDDELRRMAEVAFLG
ncbi:hypothetical protein AX17_007420 [Amanita inopinata Kibby_2008]|nr:hypothetical protein AX17_007420 [Amanita inopinata Kibby_2008]